MPFFALIDALILAAAAAAAAAAALFLSPPSLPGLVMGLRDLCDSESLRPTGERDLRSKRDLRAGSGSVWSKRDRLRGSSAMLSLQMWREEQAEGEVQQVPLYVRF